MSGGTVRLSLAELEPRRARGETRTRADAPARVVEKDFWAAARVATPPSGKVSAHLRVGADVLAWPEAQRRGHPTRVNAVLRSFLDARKRRPR